MVLNYIQLFRDIALQNDWLYFYGDRKHTNTEDLFNEFRDDAPYNEDAVCLYVQETRTNFETYTYQIILARLSDYQGDYEQKQTTVQEMKSLIMTNVIDPLTRFEPTINNAYGLLDVNDLNVDGAFCEFTLNYIDGDNDCQ